MSWRSFGLRWWTWSILFALLVGSIEILGCVVAANRGAAEVAALGSIFVGAGTAVALLATGAGILVWLLLARRFEALEKRRVWLLVYAALAGMFPAWGRSLSWVELAILAPSMIGFLTPRFVVPKLRVLGPPGVPRAAPAAPAG